jgi:precorrin-8X/cobalt-precorrin-8 methylmutase
MVDWSAANQRKKGKDSIWYCLLTRRQGVLAIEKSANPATRFQAITEIGDLLHELCGEKMKALVGFDFAYGYPAGLAKALGLSGGPAWRQIWDYHCFRITDTPGNESNRFEVADSINECAFKSAYPFWGCPMDRRYKHLKPNKPQIRVEGGIEYLRLTDRRAKENGRRIFSVWQLMGAGSVGSQSLVGMPHLRRLCSDPRLARNTLVWPFQTGLKWPPPKKAPRPLIVHAEIFGPMLPPKSATGEVRDYSQVKELAFHYARADEQGNLAAWLNGPPGLTEEERRRVVDEEGWILGIEGCQHAH